MSRQSLGNECALLSFFHCECQQNSSDDAEQDNIRKIPMNAVLPCFHSLDGHYRSMGQALARREGNQRAVQRRLSGSQQQKGAESDKPTKKHRLACVFHSSYIFPCSRRQSRTSPIWGESRATDRGLELHPAGLGLTLHAITLQDAVHAALTLKTLINHSLLSYSSF